MPAQHPKSVYVHDKDQNGITSTVSGAQRGLDVNVISGGTGGSGIQYTEGDLDASITGTAMLGEAPGDTLQPLQLDAALNLKVAVGSLSIGTGATDLGKAEDAVHTSGDTGIFMLGVRRDTLTAMTSASGDYSPMTTDSFGQLRVVDISVNATQVDGSQLTNIYDNGTGLQAQVLNTDPGSSDPGLSVRLIPNGSLAQPISGSVSISSLVPGTSATALGKAEDAVHASGDVGVMALGVRNDSGTVLQSANGDYAPFTTDDTGAVHVKAKQSTASNLKGQVEGTTAAGATPPNPVYVGMKDIATGFNVAPHVFNFGGIDYQVALTPDPDLQFEQYNANGESYSLVGSTDNTLANARYLKTDSSGDVMAVGSVAHDAADSGNPVKIGGKASTSAPTAVANGDRVDAYFDDAGRMAVFSDRNNPATSCGKTITYVPVSQVTTAGTTVLAAASPGNRHKVIGCILTMHKQGTLKFTDGSGDLTGAMNVAIDGGFVLPTSIFPYTQTAVNSALSLVTVTGGANGVVVVLTEA